MPTLVDRLLDLAVKIQQVPAPTFKEKKRALLVRELFRGERLQDVAMDQFHNVYARLPGRSTSGPLIVTAHLDTVFAGSSNPLAREHDRIHGPGIGDNSLGVAALLGLVWMLRDDGSERDSDVWLVANSCEEGLGDLRGMKGVVRRFGADVQGYLVLEGTALAQVYHRAVGVQRYRVSVGTTGGHSWSDYGQPSAVHELASIVTQLTALPLPTRPRTTMNVGTISGGSGVNVLASQAQFELDLRSEEADALGALVASVEERIRSARRAGVEVEMEVVGQRPAGEIPADHPLVQLAVACLADEGLNATLTSGSTDANIPLSKGFPAIVLGITTGAGAHTQHEYIDTAPVAKGMRQLANFVRRLVGMK
jgi:acetylornithine deacetylase/succinyl-diaminopimelate desuccinylase-like protein